MAMTQRSVPCSQPAKTYCRRNGGSAGIERTEQSLLFGQVVDAHRRRRDVAQPHCIFATACVIVVCQFLPFKLFACLQASVELCKLVGRGAVRSRVNGVVNLLTGEAEVSDGEFGWIVPSQNNDGSLEAVIYPQ